MPPIRSVTGLAILLVAAGCGAGENPASRPASVTTSFVPDLNATAQNVVARAAQVKEGDVVLITGSVRDLDLLENLSIEVQKRGAHSLVSLVSDRLARRSFDEVAAKYDVVEGKWDRLISTNADVVINVDAIESPTALDGVPPARMQARAKANAQLATLSLQRGVRMIEVGNGLYPTEARAERFGLTREELARQFWTAVNTAPTEIAAIGNRVRDALRSARQVRITHANGTDIALGLDTREIFVNDGAISPQDVNAGGASAWKYLPAGEVYVRVAPGTATGRIVADEYEYQGASVRGLTLDVASGNITSITATSGDALIAAYRSAAGDGREQLTVLDFGINPALRATQDSRVRTWVPAGMVTFVFGFDGWANGTNRAAFGISAFQPGSTVMIDGRTIVENGMLRVVE
jgi:leucyl aminopeptidase (aminopeptidase T)